MVAHRSIGARRSAGVSNTISRPDVRDIRPDALDDARRFHSEDAAGRDQIEAAATTIDVDEVDSDRCLPDASFARARLANPRPAGFQNLRAAVTRQHDFDTFDTARRINCSGGRADDDRAAPLSAQKTAHRGKARLDDIVAHEAGQPVPLGEQADRTRRAIPTSRRARR